MNKSIRNHYIEPKVSARDRRIGTRLKAGVFILAVTGLLSLPADGTLWAQADTANCSKRDCLIEKPFFGPLMERHIVHPGDSSSNCLLDLDVGEFVLAPPEVHDLLQNRFDKNTKSGRAVEPIIRWAQTSGVDLTLAMVSPEVMLTLYDGLIFPIDSFTNTNPEDLLNVLDDGKRQRNVEEKPQPPMWMFQCSGPRTWAVEIIQTMSWPKPKDKGPDNSGLGSEQQWVIDGNEISWNSPADAEVRLSFTIDPAQSPKHFDVKFLSGPFRGKESQGIYERRGVSGKMLWLCLTDPLLDTDRPAKFGMDSITRHNLIGLMPAALSPGGHQGHRGFTVLPCSPAMWLVGLV